MAYFDGPGGTQVPRQVVDAMSDYLFHHNANTHWIYPTSVETDAALDAARVALADFVNGAATEIAFGANMTTLTFHVARGLAARWGRGDEVVVTELDHHGNVAPWARLAAERGVVVKTVRMNPEEGALDWTSLEQAITPRTKLLAIGAASNALGTITDVAAAARLARAHGALTFVDAVHYAPHTLVDVKALGCDFLACSAYKFYGPHVGLLWGRGDLIASLDVPKLDSGARGRTRAPRDRDAEPRGHRRRRGGGRLSRIVRQGCLASGAARVRVLDVPRAGQRSAHADVERAVGDSLACASTGGLRGPRVRRPSPSLSTA